MSIDPALEAVFDKIPERDHNVLKEQHQITDLSKLVEKKYQLQQRQLKDVSADVQMVLDVLCSYLESLDQLSSFTWEGFENFCDFNDNSGDYVIDTAEEISVTMVTPALRHGREIKGFSVEHAFPSFELSNKPRRALVSLNLKQATELLENNDVPLDCDVSFRIQYVAAR